MPAGVLTLLQAFYRAAKGAMGMRKYGECMRLCREGLNLEHDNKELQRMLQQAGTEEVGGQAWREGKTMALAICPSCDACGVPRSKVKLRQWVCRKLRSGGRRQRQRGSTISGHLHATWQTRCSPEAGASGGRSSA
jgi:hypothetical protein